MMKTKKMKRCAALALAAVLALSMTACGSSGDSSDTDGTASAATTAEAGASADATTTASGGTFTFGCDYFSEYIDPSVNVNSAWSLVRFGVGETLFAFDEDAVAQENLCDEATTDDYITWTLHIRDGITFSNGKELTASAVVACWEMMYEKEAAGSSSAPSQYLPDPTFTADDEAGTITVVCSDVTTNLKGILAYPYFAVIDVDSYEEGVVDSVIGTGPYVLESYVEATSKTFVKNETYWNGEVPYDGYTAIYMTDSTTKALAIQSGDVDVVENVTTASDLETLKADSAYTVESTAGGRLANTYFNFEGMLGNEALRQAIQYAIDDETMCNITVGGIYTAGCSVLPSSMDFGYDQLTDPYEYDLDKAVEVLDEAGIVDTDGDGIREIDGENINLVYLTFESRQLQTFAEAIATVLNSIGIGVDYQVKDYDTILGLQIAGDFDMVSSNAIIVPTGNPDAFLGNFYSGNSQDYGYYSNEEYDAAYEKLIVSTDENEKMELYVEMQQILIDDAATIVHGYYNSSITYNNSVITGVKMYPLDYTWITTDWAPVG
ncbi:MAG: ABC transporter substrate-binding protein [Lachnospiraceae bacterium]|nr:ABC transporter substrate-binding protein [Lachnospiraceae bacterium]